MSFQKWILGIVVVNLACAGCAPYRFGNAALFPSNIRTVHVPIVANDTFRHDLGIRLTEILVREIESRTPYKVTGDPNADSVLVCRILSESKGVITENRDDDPRALDSAITVEARWVSLAGIDADGDIQFPLQSFDDWDHSLDLLVIEHFVAVRTRAFTANVDDGRTVGLHLHRSGDSGVNFDVLATIGKTIRSDVQNAHDQGTTPQGELPSTEIPVQGHQRSSICETIRDARSSKFS